MLTRLFASSVALLLALAALACGGSARTPFSPSWSNDQGASIGALERRLVGKKIDVGPGVAVGVSARGLVGVGLTAKTPWFYPVAARERPVVAGAVVVGTDASNVFGLDALTGQELWKVSHAGLALRGAGDDGVMTAVTLGRPQGGGSRLLVLSRSGTVELTEEHNADFGPPAVVDGVVFVPWGNQYVSAIEVASGDEVARLLLRKQVSHALNLGGQLYFGESEIVAFDSKIAQAWADGGTVISLPKVNLPGEPRWFRAGTASRPAQSTATDKVSLLALPVSGSLSGERFAASYFRVVFGFQQTSADLDWVRSFAADVLGGSAGNGGFVLCDSAGDVWLLDAKTGSDVGHTRLPGPLQSCVAQAGATHFPASAGKVDLPQQLTDVLTSRDTAMVAAQQIVLEALGNRQEPETAQILIKMLQTPHLSPVLRGRTQALLAKRRSGAEFMREALKLRYDFLAGREAALTAAPIAEALAAMKYDAAAPELALQLLDPALPAEDVVQVARALEVLATPEIYPALKEFFAMNRDDATEDELMPAVLSVAKGMLRVGGPEARRLVKNAVAAPMTPPKTAAGLGDLEVE